MRKIKSLRYNWFSTDSRGEDFHIAVVGEGEIIRIEEHRAGGEGDKWYYDIHLKSGEMMRVFNPNFVWFEPEDNYF